MNENLRLRILFVLREHEKSSPEFPFQKASELAKQLGQPEDEIWRQLRILEDEDLVILEFAQPGNPFFASITPSGMRYLEEIQKQIPQPEKPPMGFKTPKTDEN